MGEKVIISGRELAIVSATEEARQKDYGFIPDILVDIGGRQLAVEIFCTNPVSEEKKIKVKNSKMAMIQIDLSGVDYETLVNAELFKKLVLDDKDNRVWIYNPKGEKLVIKAKSDLAQKIKIENERHLMRKAEERKLKEERAKKKRLDDERIALVRFKKRKMIATELEQLLKYDEHSWQMQREKMLLEKALTASPKLLEIHHTQKNKSLHENLVNIIHPKDWIFNVHRILWQSHILLYYVFSQPIGYSFAASNVNRDITSRFGVLDFVKVLNLKKWEEKKKGRNQYDCWYLSCEENRAIVFPISLVGGYLDYLSSIRILSKQNTNYSVKFNNIDDWERAHQDERSKQLLLKMENYKEHQLMLAQQKINREIEQKITQKSIRKRSIEMLAAELRMYETYDGVGRLCSICLLVSNVLDGVDCPFCDGSMFKEKTLDNESMRNALYIYRCSPNPRISIKNRQLLKNLEQLELWMLKAEQIIDA